MINIKVLILIIWLGYWGDVEKRMGRGKKIEVNKNFYLVIIFFKKMFIIKV